MSRILNEAKKRYNDFIISNNLESHEHQKYGVLWCLDRECNSNPYLDNKNGGFLADEMGLGKTIMMLALIKVNILARSTLIVVPPPLLRQWEIKIENLLKVKPIVVYGYGKKKLNIENSNIVLTTYGNLKSSLPNIKEKKFDRVIFDEAHHLKNKNSECYKNALDIDSKITWLITGTPLQNKMKDIYNLGNLLNLNKSSIEKNFEKFKKICILHRKKANANIILPEVKEFIINVKWETTIEKEMLVEMMTKIDADKGNLLLHIIQQRKMCTSPNSLNENFKELYNVSDELFNGTKNSKSKINEVINIMKKNKNNGKKKMLFCHFRKEMDTIEKELEKIGYNKIEKIDGRITEKRRNEIFLEATDDDDKVFIMQIQSCSEGLNLQMFSEVYFVSPHWNPCVEEQAIARCHRLGQRQEVHVYKFKMENSIEYYIKSVQDAKIELRRGLLF